MFGAGPCRRRAARRLGPVVAELPAQPRLCRHRAHARRAADPAHRLAGIGKPRAGVAALFAARAPGRQRWHRSERAARRLRLRAVPGAAAGALGGAGLPRDARSQPGAAAHRALAPRPARGRGQRDALRGAARFIDARQPGAAGSRRAAALGRAGAGRRRAAPANAPNGRAMSTPCSSAAGCPRRCAPTMPGCARRAAPSRRCRWRSGCTSACCDAFPTPSHRRICRRASARPAPSCSPRRAPGRCRRIPAPATGGATSLPALEATLRRARERGGLGARRHRRRSTAPAEGPRLARRNRRAGRQAPRPARDRRLVAPARCPGAGARQRCGWRLAPGHGTHGRPIRRCAAS